MNPATPENLPHLEVCFSPALLPYFDPKDKIVVVIDVFRASTAICTASAHGVEIIPVKEVEDALAYRAKGYIVAAERKGEVVDGFDFGNSPFAFMDKKLKGKTVVLTTSNCTRAVLEARSEGAEQILLGSFVNISALCSYLKKQKKNVLLLCAGWKNRYNLEDSLVAGAMAEMLHEDFSVECDSALASMHLYQQAKDDLSTYLQNSSHTRRLHHLHIDKDIQFCLKKDQYTTIPFFDGRSVRPLA